MNKWYQHLPLCLICSKQRLATFSVHHISYHSLWQSLYFVFLSVLLSIGFSVDCKAYNEPTETFWINSENYAVIGYLDYVSSDGNATPVTNLDDSRLHEIRFSCDAERRLYRSPYLANAGDNTIVGYIDDYFRADLPMAGELAVRQQVRSGNNTREGTVYYRVVVEEMSTALLNRPQRASAFVYIVIAGFILATITAVFRRVLND